MVKFSGFHLASDARGSIPPVHSSTMSACFGVLTIISTGIRGSASNFSEKMKGILFSGGENEGVV